MRAVNLLPTTQGVAASLAGGRSRALVIGAVVAVGAMGWWGYSANQSADSVSAQLSQAQIDKSSLDSEVAGLSVYRQRAQAEAAQSVVVVQLAVARINWERLVRNVVTVLPSGVWLNTVNGSLPATATTTPSPAPAAGALGQPSTSAPQGLHIVGDAFTQAEVADTLARLGTVSGLGNPRLASSQVTTTSGQTIVAFTIDIPIDPQAQDNSTLTAISSIPGVTP